MGSCLEGNCTTDRSSEQYNIRYRVAACQQIIKDQLRIFNYIGRTGLAFVDGVALIFNHNDCNIEFPIYKVGKLIAGAKILSVPMEEYPYFVFSPGRQE
jgi:hypothetical protein